MAQTAPRFPVATPEAFVEFMRAQVPGPAMAWKVPAFFARHPRALTVLPGSIKALRPLDSFATTNYYALHAYHFLDADGGSRYVRYTFVPEGGNKRIGPRGGEAPRRRLPVRRHPRPGRSRPGPVHARAAGRATG